MEGIDTFVEDTDLLRRMIQARREEQPAGGPPVRPRNVPCTKLDSLLAQAYERARELEILLQEIIAITGDASSPLASQSQIKPTPAIRGLTSAELLGLSK